MGVISTMGKFARGYGLGIIGQRFIGRGECY